MCVCVCVAVLLLDALAKFRPYQKQVNFIFRADRPANHSGGSGSGSNIGSSSNNTCHLPLATCPLPAASCQSRVASCQLPLDVQKPQTQISTTTATQRNVAAAAVAARASNKNNPAIISFATMPSPWATHSHTFAFGWVLWIRVFGFYCF